MMASAEVDTRKFWQRILPWFIWSLGALFYCYEFFLQVSPSVMIDDLMREFNISAAALGNLTSYYLYFYAIMQIPVGLLLDRFGARRLLTIATLLCASGALVFAYSTSFEIAAIGRSLIGIGSAFAAVSCLHLAACWLPLNRFALMTGVLLSIGMLGAFLAEAPLAKLVDAVGWRHTLLLFGCIGLILAVVIYTVIRDRAACENTNQERVLDTNFFAGLKYLIKQKQVWITSIYGALMFMSVQGFTSLWGVPFLMTLYKLPKANAAFINSLTFIGFAVGAPFFGWLSDRVARRKVPMFIGSIGALICISAITYLSDLTLTMIGITLFLFGFFISGFLPVFSVARETTPSETNATTMGFVNTLNTLGGALAAVGIGFLLDSQWSGQMIAGSHAYSIAAYHYALAILPMAIGLSIIVLFFVKETYCKQQTIHL